MTQRQKSSEKLDTDRNDNSASTATLAAPSSGPTNHVTSVAGGYDTSVSGANLILKEGSTEVGRWMVYDTFALVFPNPLRINGAANLVLDASGSAGVYGTATITGFEE